jgi:hypothetical protein
MGRAARIAVAEIARTVHLRPDFELVQIAGRRGDALRAHKHGLAEIAPEVRYP